VIICVVVITLFARYLTTEKDKPTATATVQVLNPATVYPKTFR